MGRRASRIVLIVALLTVILAAIPLLQEPDIAKAVTLMGSAVMLADVVQNAAKRHN